MATKYPEKLSVKLQACCKQSAAQIREKQEVGRMLHAALATSPFAILLGSGPIDVAVSIGTQDWDLWGRSVKAVPVIVKERCRTIAGLEIVNHPGGELSRFWHSVHESFK